MKQFQLAALLSVMLMNQYVSCDIPNVYEFCSALMSDNRGHLSCNRSQCQGIPGKRGPEGRMGPRGLKGNRGEQGTCEDVQEQMNNLKDEMNGRLNLFPKLLYCGMGMQSKDIPDSAITASSDNDYRHAASNARLGNTGPQTTDALTVAAWCARISDKKQWIQVYFPRPRFIGGVVTQGRPWPNPWHLSRWVVSFKISCGNSTTAMSTLSQDGQDKVFIANENRNGKVFNMFPEPVTCRYIRLHPMQWYGHICLRMELIRGECHGLY